MKILIVDDESAVQRYLTEVLIQNGHQAETADRADEASHRMESTRFDLVISDIEMPGQSGLDFANDLRRDHPELPVILTTGAGNEQFLHRSRALGTGFLEKPFSANQLLEEIEDITRTSDSHETARPDR